MKPVELRHELHKCAELSGCENKTKNMLIKAIQGNTDLKTFDMGRWFYALYECDAPGGTSADGTGASGGKNIAVRADMDALPMNDIETLEYKSETAGVSHRCGHDGHSAALFGLAQRLSDEGAGNNVYLIFQHAEETGAGAEECISLIDEKNISEVYAFHNWSGFEESSVILGEGTVMCASEGLRIIMKGKPSHASQPEDGINPAKALAQVVTEADRLENSKAYHAKAMATVVGVNAGGRNFGMSPGEGEVDLTLRALHEEDMIGLEEELVAFARKTGKEAGLDVIIEKQDVFPDTSNCTEAVTKVKAAAEKLGLAVCSLEKPIRSSEDFGWFQKKCSGAMIFIGNGMDWPQIHTVGYDFNDRILETAAGLMYEIVK